MNGARPGTGDAPRDYRDFGFPLLLTAAVMITSAATWSTATTTFFSNILLSTSATGSTTPPIRRARREGGGGAAAADAADYGVVGLVPATGRPARSASWSPSALRREKTFEMDTSKFSAMSASVAPA